jgi:pullulanase/glycogen debranching enzyme
MLLTMQGRIIMQGGDEFARSKPQAANAPNPERAFTSVVARDEYGRRYFQENSYGPPDFTNRIDWARMEEFKELREYVQGLIGIRRMLPALRYASADEIRQGLRFLETPYQQAPTYVAYQLDNTIGGPERFSPQERFQGDRIWRKVVVIHNVHFAELILPLPGNERWQLLADGQQALLRPIEHTAVQIMAHRITVPPHTSVILVAE